MKSQPFFVLETEIVIYFSSQCGSTQRPSGRPGVPQAREQKKTKHHDKIIDEDKQANKIANKR
jgi:hypothetical protein